MAPYFFLKRNGFDFQKSFNSLKQIMRILIKTCKWEPDVLHRKQNVTIRSFVIQDLISIKRKTVFWNKNQLVKRLHELIWRRWYWLQYAIIVGLRCLPLFEYKFSTLFHKINTSCHYESWSEKADFQIGKNKV